MQFTYDLSTWGPQYSCQVIIIIIIIIKYYYIIKYIYTAQGHTMMQMCWVDMQNL